MRPLNIFVLLVCGVLLCACDSLVNDMDEDKLPKMASKLVVDCYISPQSKNIEVVVTESQPLFGPSTYNPVFISNAEVTLTGGGLQIKIPYIHSISRYRVDSSAFRIIAGQTYTLTVNDGRRLVKAMCTVPASAPAIKNVSVEKLPIANSADSAGRVHTSWEDIRGESNYYTVRGYMVLEETMLRFDPQTGDVDPFRNVNKFELRYYPLTENLFNDTNLDGASFNAPEFGVYMSPRRTVTYQDKKGVLRSFDNDPRMSELRVEILNIDENYYKFYRSIGNSGNGDNPFVEPTLIYTNVEGGLGCFGAFNMVGRTVRP
jgi:hypothetical protein